MRLARILVEGRSSWEGVAFAACDDFTVEAADEAGQIVLTVPGRWMWAHLVQTQVSSSHDGSRT
ncbi:hypothetical protein DC522_15315 [Microvirga sp. KLBC 81]|nr:hypothetical protein DC522_15315 [Microvirga sp. KLBC 81]